MSRRAPANQTHYGSDAQSLRLRGSLSGALSSRRREHRTSQRPCTIRPVEARRKQGPEPEPASEENEASGFLPRLFGTGTQRVKLDKEPTEQPRLPGPAFGTQRFQKGKSQSGGGSGLQQQGTRRASRRDSDTVFVAGSTGRLGLRIVRQLLLAGVKVRAGARNTSKAQEYADLAVSLGILPPDTSKRLQIVRVDLEDTETIIAAIGNAGKVVQAIGAAEDNVLDIGAPKRIDGDAAINLVNAAVEAGVEQYVMVTSLGTGKFGWPAGALNLFGGILVQKRRAEKALESSGLPFVIVRPGGMERPTDDYKKTNNVRLATKDKLFGGQVSRLQVAELVAAAVSSPELAENKIVEVVAEVEAPNLEYPALLGQHPSEFSQEERARQRKSEEGSRARIEAAQQELKDADEARKEAQTILQQLQDELNSKRAEIKQVEREAEPILREAQQVESQLVRVREELEQSQAREEAARAVLDAARAAQKNSKQQLSAEETRSIEASVLSPPAKDQSSAAPRKQTQKTKQPWRFSGRQQEKLAEQILRKEIDLKLGKADPQPSEKERRLAEGVAQKEIAIGTGKVAPVDAQPVSQKKGPFETADQEAESKVEAPLKQEAPPPKIAQTSPEELARLRAARTRSVEVRAKREADFLARMDAERREAAAKKADAASKREAEARKASAELRSASLAKMKGKLARETSAVRDFTDKGSTQPVKQSQTATSKPSAEKRPSSNVSGTEEKAKQNSQQARQWIAAWRKEQAEPKSSSKSGSSATEWQQNGGSALSGNDAAEVKDGPSPNNVQEAREWIRDWRARTLESKLPENSSARK